MVRKIHKVDTVVLGGGPGGVAAALTAVKAGLKVVIADPLEPGGVCLNRGCVPAKTWLCAEHAYRISKWAEKLGAAPPVAYDFKKIAQHKESVIQLGRKSLTHVLNKRGVEWISGTAAFTSSHQLEINSGEKKLEFQTAVIATGSQPIEIFDTGGNFYNSDNIFSLEKLPSSVIIIGGGVCGVEMATFFAGMDCKVTLIEALPDILPSEDAELRAIVKRELKKTGVTIKTGVMVKSAKQDGGGCMVETSGGVFTSEIALSAVGRMGRTESMGLDKAGVRVDVKGFIEVDGSMRTSREGIYAVGDVAGKSLLAYTAHHEGIVAGRNIAGNAAAVDYRFVPSIIFTHPEIGSVGYTEEELKQIGAHYRAGRHYIRALARAQAGGETAGLVKVLIAEDNSILGIHVASAGATEIIHSGVVAMLAGMKADKLADCIFGHPTIAEAIPLATADALGTSIYT